MHIPFVAKGCAEGGSRLFYYWRRNLEEFLTRHSGPALLLCALFVVGIIFGALAVRSLDTQDKLDLVRYLSSVTPALERPDDGAGALLLKRQLWGKAKLVALLWVSGISLVGALGVMLLSLLRGFLTGFVVAFLAAEMGLPGVLLALAGHVPQSLLEVPAIILGGTASVAFSLQVVRSWRERRRVPHFYRALASYTGTLLVMGALLVGASLVESYLSPALIRLASSFLHGG